LFLALIGVRVGVADGYGSAGFFEVVQGLHPRGIPKSEARGGAGVAVTKVKKYLAKMDRAVDYDFYDDDDLRYVRFKSPFDRRPLIGRRPHPGYVVLDALRSCLLVCSARLAIKSLGDLFGANLDGSDSWCLRRRRAGRTRGSAPSASSGAAARTTCDNGAPLRFADFGFVSTIVRF